jgi:hypothetical protein
MYRCVGMTIPGHIRHLSWTHRFGYVFKHKCWIKWCDNEITVWNFHCGHDIPDSKGGTIELDNLYPICASCNLSMSNNYTIKEWNNKLNRKIKFCCL